MLHRLRKHASPALIVAVLALIVGVAGTAVAGVATISTLSKQEKKKVKKIVNKQIKKKAAGLSVANAVNAENADKANNIFGASVLDNGTITASTLPGTTVQKNGDVFTYTFPRSVQGCIPVGTGWSDGNTSALLSGTANPNSVDVSNGAGTANSVIVLCP